MAKTQDLERFRRPELFLSELISRSARGEMWGRDENVTVLHRATVVAVDVLGGRLENPAGEGSVSHSISGRLVEVPARVGVSNPRNSVKARIVTKEHDQYVGDDDLRVFWPLMQEHDALPIKPGEHVYVLFEDDGWEHGLWVGKVSGHENLNVFRGEEAFASRSSLATKFGIDEPTSRQNDQDASGRLMPKDLTKLFGA